MAMRAAPGFAPQNKSVKKAAAIKARLQRQWISRGPTYPDLYPNIKLTYEIHGF